MKSIVTLVAASALVAAAATAQPPNYTLIDLGTVGPAGQPFNVTNNGLISGASAASKDSERSLLWYQGLGLKIDIGLNGLGGRNSSAFWVNQSGQTSGQAETYTADPNGEDFCGFKATGFTSSGTCVPFLWYGGRMTSLPTLGGPNGEANMVNNRGEVAGVAETSAKDPGCPAPQILQFKPVIWANGKIEQALPTFPGDTNGVANSINDEGQAVGASGSCGAFNPNALNNLQALHALLWENGVATDLGNLGGTGHGLGNVAQEVNNLGQAVGVSDLAGDMASHAFLWTRASGMRDLGTLPGDIFSVAVAINDLSQVTGVSLDAEFNLHPFFWQNGVMTDVSTLIPANSHLLPLLACGINSNSEFVGIAVNKVTGEVRGYLALPSTSAAARAMGAANAEDSGPVDLSDEARQTLQQMRLGRLGVRLPAPQ